MSRSVYEMVTDRIIAELEKGKIPWQKPSTGTPDGAFNRVTKHPYSLINQMLLGKAGEWASFKQWSELGGKIKKGEKSSFVVFWKVETKTEIDENGEEIEKSQCILRYYNVFHISQVEGVKPLDQKELKTVEPIKEAERILQNYWMREKITVEHVISDKAYYSPSQDLIHLPLIGQFINSNEYYSTAFHESIHSTMKENRCNRAEERKGKLVAFGSEEYSKEELIAEIGSATLLNMIGIETDHSFKNSSAYIQSWLSVLKNDNRFIISASTKAEKAVKYIMEA